MSFIYLNPKTKSFGIFNFIIAMKYLSVNLILVSLFLFVSCKSKVASIDEGYKNKESQQIAFDSKMIEARKLYREKCSFCHTLHKPNAFSPKEWKQILVVMQKEAQISDEQRELIFDYLTK